MFKFEACHKVFDLIHCSLEFRFCIFEGQPFLIKSHGPKLKGPNPSFPPQMNGHTRVVNVQLGNETLFQSIHKLLPL